MDNGEREFDHFQSGLNKLCLFYGFLLGFLSIEKNVLLNYIYVASWGKKIILGSPCWRGCGS